MAVREYEVLPARMVRDSNFVVELHFDAPFGFWEEGVEPPYFDPFQKYFWKRAMPSEQSEGWTWKDTWLANLHQALRKRGWPDEYTEALYSYSEGEPWNPSEGDEPDEDVQPLVGFWVRIPGEWLEDHPKFFKDLEKLENKGVNIKMKRKEQNFKLAYWRISAEFGELGGTDWEGTIFLVKPRKTPPGFEGGPRDWFPE